MIRTHVLAWARRYAGTRPADFVIGAQLLERWWLIPRNNIFNIYLHRFNDSDEDRALHDHMYANLSWILGPGGYHEIMQSGGKWRHAGAVVTRLPSTAHRIVLPGRSPVWSLFITGPRVRQWGFLCPQGWRHWREFTDARDSGQIGRGCDP